MFRNLKNFNPAEIEEKVLEFWRANKIFEKSIEKPASEKSKGNYVFFDGPPFANGLPHYGHILASIIKDAIPRYQTMKGKSVKRRWGWDCHGLPVEFEIEKELGLKSKKDIIDFGVEKFNEAARKSVLKYESEWKKTIPRIGRWVDMDNPYKTMDVEYMESVLRVFKDLYDKDLIYKGYKPMHICPRCETTLSNFEVTQNYKDIEDSAVTLKFKLVDEPNTFILAWTTTAWTLPGNVALAVNRNVDYVKMLLKNFSGISDGVYIFSKKDYENYQGMVEAEKKKNNKVSAKILEEFKGEKLIGKNYQPLFDYYAKDKKLVNRENGWKIYPADFVNIEEGTGIVHIAPAFGAEDMELGQKFNLPFVQHVGMDGKIKQEVKDFAGLRAKSKENTRETDEKIIKFLSDKNSVFGYEKVVHSYPHCWRCETPLLNYAASSWFVKVMAVKNALIKNNQKINWLPAHVKDGRFGQWLKDARDWAISRSRFWGSPLPVWECKKCGKLKVVGSVEEIKKNSETSGNKYFVMRHGESENNLFNVVSSDYKNKHHLTEKGKREVKDSLKKLRGVDLIFSSDFVRTKETAEIAAKQLRIKKIFYDKRLREVNAGILNNRPTREYGEYFSSNEEKFIKPAPKGENLTDLKNRTADFIYDIEKKYSGKNILIISHEYPIWLLFVGAEGADAKKAIEMKSKKDKFIKTGEIKNLKFVPLPHNKNFELDLHRPYIDKVEFICGCGGKMKRIEDVFDCWFESGSMPYGQSHYPFAFAKNQKSKIPCLPAGRKNQKLGKLLKKMGFPAEFIAEGMDQTRGWFYTLLVLSTALFNKPAYKNVIVNGIILAENGQKMSKRLKNYPDPMELVSRYGADSLRLYLLSSSVVAGENLNFSEKGVDEIYKKMILRLWNIYKFYELYADSSKIQNTKYKIQNTNILDKWIIARLEQLKQEVSNSLGKYELDKAVRPLGGFIDDFSTWYIRRSRDRFVARRLTQTGRGLTQKDIEQDKNSAINTTHFVLSEFSKILAPFTPFVAEAIYKNLKSLPCRQTGQILNLKFCESVHLEKWPNLDKKLIDKKLINSMVEIRRIASLALELRTKAGIKVRQPLSELRIKDLELRNKKELLKILADEINVKKVIFDSKIKQEIELDIKITPELKTEGLLREAARAIQDLRKEAGLLPKDKINLWLEIPAEIRSAIDKNISEFKEKICAKNINFGRTDKFDVEAETKMDGVQIWAGIKKV